MPHNNKVQTVRSVVAPIVISEDMPKEPANIDLRFFREITLVDTWNGVGVPWDGLMCNILFYGSRPVYQYTKRYDGGNGGGDSWTDGSEFYYTMSKVARLYGWINEIAHRQFHGQEPPPDIDEEKADLVGFVFTDTLELLTQHPQYLDLVESMNIVLAKVADHTVRVTTSKRAA